MTALGAYGFRVELDGDGDGSRWLVPQLPDAPVLRLRRIRAEPSSEPAQIDGEVLNARFAEGLRVRARNGEETIDFIASRELSDAELIHPCLANPAAIHWAWKGGESLHAGAFVTDGGAVLLLGTNEAGKTTTLDHLATERGVTVLADDLAVLDRGDVMAGPRGLDLRRPAAPTAAPERTNEAVLVRDGQRLRRGLPAAPARAPVRAWVALAWGDRLALEPVDAATRLRTLAAARRVRSLSGDGTTVLELAALPAYRLVRPRLPGLLEASVSLMLDRLSM